MLVRRACDGVTAQHHPATVSPRKVNDRTAGEVAADSMKHHPGQHLRLLIPGCDHRVVSLDPLPVSRLHVDRHAAEPVRPLHLHPEHVWMAGSDGSHPTQLVNGRNQVIVEVSVRIPQKVARRRLDEQGTLSDPDRRLDRDAVQTGLDFGNRSPVPSSAQLLQGGPPLAGGAHILPLIAADRADRGWLTGIRLLNSAGTTDKDRHDALLGFEA